MFDPSEPRSAATERARGGFLRLWFGFSQRVDRHTYLRTGITLMLVKYAVDAALLFAVSGRLWPPFDYLSPRYSQRTAELTSSPAYIWIVSATWSLPFIWIGVSMTMRRAIDAGRSPWMSYLFFVPLVNYALMILLSLLPTRPGAWERAQERASAARPDNLPPLDLLRATLGTIVASSLGLVALVYFGANIARGYGLYLFLGCPFVLGATAGYLPNRRRLHSRHTTLTIAMLSLLLTMGLLLLFAIEGIVCIGMMIGLALPVMFMGVVFGYAIASVGKGSARPVAYSVAGLPLLMLAESTTPPAPPIEVATEVEIDAPPEVVWHNVVSFSELPEPDHWLFETGIAYPRRARIEGHGIGAVRYCEFSTGAFVEPITHWDEPRRLAFDVSSQPVPMEEWSFYEDLHPPHLDGYFRSVRGEFRLTALPGGRTRLEGSTWYRLDLRPHAYWRFFADAIVHRIHLRVLRHVRALSESAARPEAQPLGK